MERGTSKLTLTLLIFEATDGKRTLTDAVARAFAPIFNPESAWHARVSRDSNHTAASEDGNAATDDHFYYVVDPNSRTDDMFLSSFVEHCARYATREDPPATKSKLGVISSIARLVMNMAAAVGLEALRDWSNDGASSIESVELPNRQLNEQAKDWKRRGGQGRP